MKADLVRPKRPAALSIPPSNCFSISIEIRTESSPGSRSSGSLLMGGRKAYVILIDVCFLGDKNPSPLAPIEAANIARGVSRGEPSLTPPAKVQEEAPNRGDHG